jgi:AraC family transcriptional regulator
MFDESRDHRRAAGTIGPVEIVGAGLRLVPSVQAEGERTGAATAEWREERQGIRAYQWPPLLGMHTLSILLSPLRGTRWHDDRLIFSGQVRSGSAFLVPAEIGPRGLIDGPWRLLQIYIPESCFTTVAADADTAAIRLAISNPQPFFDPILMQIGQLLPREMALRDRLSRLQLDSLVIFVCARLVRRMPSQQAMTSRAREVLSPRQLRRVLDFMRQRLEDSPNLDELAAEAGMSRYHFARAFKQSTGHSPHAYLIGRRLEHAKDLLASTDRSVTEIAAQVGYDDSTQLSRLFQKELAMSPSAYRSIARS